ncbi:hypothetical protein [Spirosoma aerophilum]
MAGSFVWLSGPLLAQQPFETVYRIKVVTKSGERYRGLLSDITDSNVYLGKSLPGAVIPLSDIQKVVLRRNSKKNALITGASIGGLVTGFAAFQSLKTNQARTLVTYGLTLTFAAASGAAAGMLVGSGIGNLKKIVIRPVAFANPEQSLFRQLEPFTTRYQEDVIKRLP